MSCLEILFSKVSQFLKNAGFFLQHILKSKSGYQEPLSLMTILEFFNGWSLCGITSKLSVTAPQERLKNTDLFSV